MPINQNGESLSLPLQMFDDHVRTGRDFLGHHTTVAIGRVKFKAEQARWLHCGDLKGVRERLMLNCDQVFTVRIGSFGIISRS